MKTKFGYDDSLDAFGVHGVGGIFGALATGLFATLTVNAADNGGANGLFYGDPGQFTRQATAVGITMAYSFVISFVLFKIVDKTMKLRVTEHEENVGLDLTQHREAAYTVID